MTWGHRRPPSIQQVYMKVRAQCCVEPSYLCDGINAWSCSPAGKVTIRKGNTFVIVLFTCQQSWQYWNVKVGELQMFSCRFCCCQIKHPVQHLSERRCGEPLFNSNVVLLMHEKLEFYAPIGSVEEPLDGQFHLREVDIWNKKPSQRWWYSQAVTELYVQR